MLRKFRIKLILFVLLTLLWYWLRRPTQEEAYIPEPVEIVVPPEAPEEPAPAPPPGKVPEAPLEVAPAPQEIDDLTRISGIGPKTSAALQTAGITTFAQMAEMEVEEIQLVLTEAGIRRGNPESWWEQARKITSGEL